MWSIRYSLLVTREDKEFGVIRNYRTIMLIKDKNKMFIHVDMWDVPTVNFMQSISPLWLIQYSTLNFAQGQNAACLDRNLTSRSMLQLIQRSISYVFKTTEFTQQIINFRQLFCDKRSSDVIF